LYKYYLNHNNQVHIHILTLLIFYLKLDHMLNNHQVLF